MDSGLARLRSCARVMTRLGPSAMSEVARVDKAFETACRQVGQFLYHFSLLERELDDGIGKLLGIEAGAVDIVTANMDFARKVNVLRSAEVFKAEMPDEVRKKLLEETFSAIWSLNDKRKVVAHCPSHPESSQGWYFVGRLRRNTFMSKTKNGPTCSFKPPLPKPTRRGQTWGGLSPRWCPTRRHSTFPTLVTAVI